MSTDTADALWEAYIHALNGAYLGKHNERDHLGNERPLGSHQRELAGKRLCDGRVRVVVYSLAGDMEYFANELLFPHFNSQSPCWFCPASRSPSSCHTVTDMAMAAGWKRALVSPAQDFVTKITVHPASKLRNFSRFLAPFDLMHTGQTTTNN